MGCVVFFSFVHREKSCRSSTNEFNKVTEIGLACDFPCCFKGCVGRLEQ